MTVKLWRPSLPPSLYWPGPYDEVLRLCERCHVSERWLDEAVGRVTQEVPKHTGSGGRGSFGGEANLGGIWCQVVGGVQVEVGDMPEPACVDDQWLIWGWEWWEKFKTKQTKNSENQSECGRAWSPTDAELRLSIYQLIDV